MQLKHQLTKGILSFAGILLALQLSAQQHYRSIYPLKEAKRTIICGTPSDGFSPDSIGVNAMDFSVYHHWANFTFHARKNVKTGNDYFKIEIQLDRPVYAHIGGYGHENLLEPGDSIVITRYKEGNLNLTKYSGKGSEKLSCIYELNMKLWYPLGEITNWSLQLADSIAGAALKIINRYKPRLSPEAYALLVADYTAKEADFGNLLPLLKHIDLYSIKARQLYDKELKKNRRLIDPANPVLQFSHYYPKRLGQQALVRCAMDKGFNWHQTRDGFSKEGYTYLSRMMADMPFALRERVIGHYLDQGFDRTAFTADLENCTKDYLSKVTPGSSYDTGIKNWLNLAQGRFRKGTPVFPFAFSDTSGNIVRLQDLRGKVLLIDFMYTGCVGCMDMVRRGLPEVEAAFKDRDDVQFVSISTTPELADVKRGVGFYSMPGSLQLYTNGEGYDCAITRYYSISSYPVLMLVDKEGKMFSSRPPDPRPDKGQALIAMIREALYETN